MIIIQVISSSIMLPPTCKSVLNHSKQIFVQPVQTPWQSLGWFWWLLAAIKDITKH